MPGLSPGRTAQKECTARRTGQAGTGRKARRSTGGKARGFPEARHRPRKHRPDGARGGPEPRQATPESEGQPDPQPLPLSAMRPNDRKPDPEEGGKSMARGAYQGVSHTKRRQVSKRDGRAVKTPKRGIEGKAGGKDHERGGRTAYLVRIRGFEEPEEDRTEPGGSKGGSERGTRTESKGDSEKPTPGQRQGGRPLPPCSGAP